MKDKDVLYRPGRAVDEEALLSLILSAWHYRKWVPPRAVRAMGQYYLYKILSRSDVVQVAVRQGQVVGVAAERMVRNGAAAYRLRKWGAFLRVLLCGQGTRQMLQFIQCDRMERSMLKKTGLAFDGALNLLVVREDQKGRGIGGELYRRFLGQMEALGLKRFYLLTDSACDYQYYERQGLRRIAQRTFYWREAGPQGRAVFPEEYYLYCND